MASSATFEVTPTSYGVGSVHNTKFDFGKLYLRQILAGSGMNQSDVIVPSAATGLGQTTVNNWGIYDGVGSAAALVAYGQGMHTMAGNWHNWFSMVFELQRFKGSTLQIMGASIAQASDWAIVGGTGDFEMAYGVIRRTEHSFTGDEKIHELTIDGYCRTKSPPVPTPTKMSIGGGSGTYSLVCRMEGKSQRLESVTVRHNFYIDNFAFSYLNENGQIRDGPWGNTDEKYVDPNSTLTTIKFGPSEYVKAISGNVLSNYIVNFKIITNIATYGPFGSGTGSTTAFNVPVPVNKTVVGFHTVINSDTLSRIGAYII